MRQPRRALLCLLALITSCSSSVDEEPAAPVEAPIPAASTPGSTPTTAPDTTSTEPAPLTASSPRPDPVGPVCTLEFVPLDWSTATDLDPPWTERAAVNHHPDSAVAVGPRGVRGAAPLAVVRPSHIPEVLRIDDDVVDSALRWAFPTGTQALPSHGWRPDDGCEVTSVDRVGSNLALISCGSDPELIVVTDEGTEAWRHRLDDCAGLGGGVDDLVLLHHAETGPSFVGPDGVVNVDLEPHECAPIRVDAGLGPSPVVITCAGAGQGGDRSHLLLDRLDPLAGIDAPGDIEASWVWIVAGTSGVTSFARPATITSAGFVIATDDRLTAYDRTGETTWSLTVADRVGVGAAVNTGLWSGPTTIWSRWLLDPIGKMDGSGHTLLEHDAGTGAILDRHDFVPERALYRGSDIGPVLRDPILVDAAGLWFAAEATIVIPSVRD